MHLADAENLWPLQVWKCKHLKTDRGHKSECMLLIWSAFHTFENTVLTKTSGFWYVLNCWTLTCFVLWGKVSLAVSIGKTKDLVSKNPVKYLSQPGVWKVQLDWLQYTSFSFHNKYKITELLRIEQEQTESADGFGLTSSARILHKKSWNSVEWI